MKSILNNLILAINNLTAAINKKNNSYNTTTTSTGTGYTYPSTSNPYSSNVKVTSYAQNNSTEVTITREEYNALKAVYNAVTDKGSHPKHHDHVARELKTKWPVLDSALKQVVKACEYKHSSYNKQIWKNK
jgi:hypothetical protein